MNKIMLRIYKDSESWKWSVLVDDCVALTEHETSNFYSSFSECSASACKHVQDILDLCLIVDKPCLDKSFKV